ncbi:MAG: peptide synthetase [Mesorhizobium sp.]|uniref:AMP-binding protein n=1 Tax=Mesorhizobium sp. TaxID=1871066 RepID=UPI000FEA3C86|nr:AMP-binding protein [Mesorhizobium sp.]RWM09762.1 MAG: peptide synthetase [Mesorhizobium sp.]
MHTLIPNLSGPRRRSRFGHDTVADVIGKTLGKFSSNIAVRTDENGDVSYGELGKSASSLMGRLEAAGVRRGDAVIVKLGRSTELVATILATQMLGAAFVPVDAAETDQRLDHIKRNTNASAMVDPGPKGSVRVRRLPIPNGVDPAFPDIAYIMHTSGSTGIPKGVPVSQAALLNLVAWYIDMIHFSESASISQLTRPAFDLSIPEFFVPFATGGTIVVPSTQLHAQIIQTINFLAQSGTNVIQMVPTLLRRFLGALERLPHIAERFAELKYVVCNGESLPDSLRRRFYSNLPKAVLINSYGPTECCVAVSFDYCPRDDVELPVSVGEPACNIDFFVLDENQCRADVEVEGELWIGGVQTSERYVADEAQSDLRFVRCMTAAGEQLLYRTGDYVVASEERGLRFVGRKDDQIKFRGTRLEKGEITSAIDATGLCVDSAVVVVDLDDDAGQELVSFVTPASADIEELHRRLSGALPKDRVPRLIVPVVEIPFTVNGKLDERALQRVAKEALSANGIRHKSQASHAAESPLDHLLEAVHAVTGRVALPSWTAREHNIDSLNFLEIQLKLAERGFMFGDDVYQERSISLEEWARRLQPLDRIGQAQATIGRAARFRDELAQLLEHVEARAPAMIILHSSLVALRGVGANDVASALLETIERVSASSTVILPAFTLSYCTTRYFHWMDTKSETGVLADLVTRELPSGRTRHPAYSMVVTGPRAEELCELDWWKRTPFGDDSIFGETSRSDGLIVGLGTSSFTHVHRCELLAGLPYSKTMDLEGIADFGGGPVDVSTPVYCRDVEGRPEYSFLAHDTERDIREMRDVLCELAIGGTYARLVGAREMEAKLVPVMRTEPYGFLHEGARAEAQRAYPCEEQDEDGLGFRTLTQRRS